MAKKSKVPADQVIGSEVEVDTVDTTFSNDDGPLTHESSSEFKGPDAPAELPVAKGPKAPRQPRSAKTFNLYIGTDPIPGQKPLGVASATHGIVLIEAVKDLIAEGKDIATRDEIMARALELGIREKKPTKSTDEGIFSWWRKPLVDAGWLKDINSSVAKIIADAATEAGSEEIAKGEMSI